MTRAATTLYFRLFDLFSTAQPWTVLKLLRDHRFAGTGAWSDDDLIQRNSDGFSHCISWNFMTTFSKGRTRRGSGHANYPEDCILVVHPGWKTFCASHASERITQHKEAPNLRGLRLYSRNASLDVIGKYVDAFCYNLYGQWSPACKASAFAAEVGEPLIVTEYYAKGMDAVGLSNRCGAGWCVPPQADRGLFYQNFCLDLMESKICLAWHWFKYQDNDPTDTTKAPSNLNSKKRNKGILDNHTIIRIRRCWTG